MGYEETLRRIKVGRRYVFYESALSSINIEVREAAQGAISSLSQELTQNKNEQHTQNQSLNRIDTALSFLHSAAEFERQKELRFFSNFKSNYPEALDLFKDLKLEDITKDYLTFIAKINRALRGTTNFKRAINDELKRIERYNAAQPFFSQEKKRNHQSQSAEFYEKATQGQTMYSANESLFSTSAKDRVMGLMNNKTNEANITNLVLDNVGKNIIVATSNGLQLNSQNFVALINLLTNKLQNMITMETGKITKENIQSAGKTLVTSPEFEKYVDNLLSAPDLAESLSTVSAQFGMTDNENLEKIHIYDNEIKTIKNKIKRMFGSLKGAETFDSWLIKNQNQLNLEEIVKSIYAVKVQGYYTGEDMSLDALLSSGIGAFLGGRKNATDDIQAGKLIITIDISPEQEQAIRKYEQQMLHLQNKYFDQLDKTTDLKSFQDNTNYLRELRKQQKQALLDLQKEVNIGEDALKNGILQHVNIHDTIKGYSSAGSQYFSTHGFSGAAFGSNLTNQLNIIASMQATGGLTEKDVEFFKWAMLNAGALMIGKNLKPQLEDYFSIFVGFLMFNDATLMVEDAKNRITNSTVEDLHLYDLNGVFVPSSYLLQKTWEELTKTTLQLQQESLSGQATKAKLYTYNDNYLTKQEGNSKVPDWEGTYNKAEETTKLEMHFLAGFADLLDSIVNIMNGL